MPRRQRRVMNPKWLLSHLKSRKRLDAEHRCSQLQPSSDSFLPTITLRKAQSPVLLPGAFGSKLAKYVRVSRTTMLFVGDLNTVKGWGLARRLKLNKLHFQKVQVLCLLIFFKIIPQICNLDKVCDKANSNSGNGEASICTAQVILQLLLVTYLKRIPLPQLPDKELTLQIPHAAQRAGGGRRGAPPVSYT